MLEHMHSQTLKVAGFIKKLYRIINTPEYNDVICWTEDGKTVKISDYKQLESKVLQQNFRHRNYHSFIRQLNMYGFSKMEKSSITVAAFFTHRLFQKDSEINLPLIKTKHELKRIQLEARQIRLEMIKQQKMIEEIYKNEKDQNYLRKLNSFQFKNRSNYCSENILNFDSVLNHAEFCKKQFNLNNEKRFETSKLIDGSLLNQRGSLQRLIQDKSQYVKTQMQIDANYPYNKSTIKDSKSYYLGSSIVEDDLTKKRESNINVQCKTLRISDVVPIQKVYLQKELSSPLLSNNPIPTLSLPTPQFYSNQTISFQPQSQPMFYHSQIQNNNIVPLLNYQLFGNPLFRQIVTPFPQMCYQYYQPSLVCNMF